MSNPEKYPIGGAWPLGQFTVAAAGTPVPVYTPPPQGALVRNAGCRMLTVQALSTNTGTIAVMYGDNPATDTNHILAIVAAGQIVSLPLAGPLTESRIDLGRIYLDASAAGQSAIVVAYDAG